MQPVSVQDADQDKVPAGTQRRRQSLFHPFADEKAERHVRSPVRQEPVRRVDLSVKGRAVQYAPERILWQVPGAGSVFRF